MKAVRLSLAVLAAALLIFASVGVADASSRQGNFRFYGTVQNMAAGMNGVWIVDGRSVQVTPATRLTHPRHSPITVGSYVEVRGWLQADGSVSATRIKHENQNRGRGGMPQVGATQIEFYGTVQNMPANMTGTWMIGGRTIQTTPSTRIDPRYGPIGIGSLVEVKGWLQADGSVNAIRIKGEDRPGRRGDNVEIEFYATVQSMPAGMIGTWIIGGRTVQVTPATRLDQRYGPLSVGSLVEVKGWLQPDGSVSATKLEVER